MKKYLDSHRGCLNCQNWRAARAACSVSFYTNFTISTRHRQLEKLQPSISLYNLTISLAGFKNSDEGWSLWHLPWVNYFICVVFIIYILLFFGKLCSSNKIDLSENTVQIIIRRSITFITAIAEVVYKKYVKKPQCQYYYERGKSGLC